MALSKIQLSTSNLQDTNHLHSDTKTQNYPRVFYSTDPEHSDMQTIQNHITQVLANSRIAPSEISLVSVNADEVSPFLRDSRVTLFSGKQLLPYPVNKNGFILRLRSILPETANHFLINRDRNSVNLSSTYGNGMEKNEVDFADFISKKLNLPIKNGKSCIEGGNCFLFLSGVKKKAILGEVSLYLTFLALEQQNHFKEMEISDTTPISSTAYRIARNLKLHQKYTEEPEAQHLIEVEESSDSIETEQQHQIEIEEFSEEQEFSDSFLQEELEFYRNLVAPLTADQINLHKIDALSIQHKLNISQQIIAEDLEIPLSDIAIVPQFRFHIDMEMCVTPQGEVLIHDDSCIPQFMDGLVKNTSLSDTEKTTILDFQKVAQKNKHEFDESQNKRFSILENHQINYSPMAAVFELPNKCSLNYCNGLFLKNDSNPSNSSSSSEKQTSFTFLTTGPSESFEMPIHRHFKEQFEKNYTNYSLINILNMSKFISETQGGIHCLSFETTITNTSN